VLAPFRAARCEASPAAIRDPNAVLYCAADDVRGWLGRLQAEWRVVLRQITDDDLRSAQRKRWPFQDRPFGDVIA
jgi:hypothetical protein